MISIALILFALAALGGIGLAWMHFENDDAPLSIAAVHGLLGAAGLVTLLWTLFQSGGDGLLWGSAVLFVLTALGGFLLIANHLREESLSSSLIFAHGGAAVVAFVLLLIVYFG